MSRTKTTKSDTEVLSSIDSRLTVLLSIMLRNNNAFLDETKGASTNVVKFLVECGIETEEIAKMLGTTKNSIYISKTRIKKGKK